MPFSLEKKRLFALEAPLGPGLRRVDTKVISRAGWFQIITPSAKAWLNEVYFSEIVDNDVDRVIDETIAMYRAHGIPTKWCVTPQTRPANLGAHLTRRGFRHWGVRAMGSATSAASTQAPQKDVTVRLVEDEPALQAFLAVSSAGWSTPEGEKAANYATHLHSLREEPRVAYFFAAFVEGKIVGTAALFMRENYGYFVGGLVLPEARGRGAYRALTAARLDFLHARGIEYAVTHAREETSAPILERAGFETLYPWTCYLLENE